MIDRGLPCHSEERDVWSAERFDATVREHDSLPIGGYYWGGMTPPDSDPGSIHSCPLDPEREQRLARLAAPKPATAQGCTVCGKSPLRAAGYCHACYVKISRKLTCTRCGGKRAGPSTGLCFSCYVREASQ